MLGRRQDRMLDRLRARLDGSLLSLGRAFALVRLSPTVWTVVGLVASLTAATAYGLGGQKAQLIAGILILSAGFFDLIDGAVARATSTASKLGGFIDSTLDRVGEVAIFAGILLGRLAGPLIIVLALSLSLLVSYARAKAESLGVSLSGVGVGERSERLLLLSVSSILGLTAWGVLVVTAAALLTFLERLSRVSKALR